MLAIPAAGGRQPDELMIVTALYDHDARKKCSSVQADAFGSDNYAAEPLAVPVFAGTQNGIVECSGIGGSSHVEQHLQV
jgi:hypothetical protein